MWGIGLLFLICFFIIPNVWFMCRVISRRSMSPEEKNKFSTLPNSVRETLQGSDPLSNYDTREKRMLGIADTIPSSSNPPTEALSFQENLARSSKLYPKNMYN